VRNAHDFNAIWDTKPAGAGTLKAAGNHMNTHRMRLTYSSPVSVNIKYSFPMLYKITDNGELV
jgi:hypothetical protein